MIRKKQRLYILLLCAIGIGSATALTLTAFQDNLVFFRSPSDIAREAPPLGRAFRLGGLVEEGSVRREGEYQGRPAIHFRVTDGAQMVAVVFTGVLPDLFREGQGVVTQGMMGADGVFRAREVLARHDETYMPPEVADALKRSGHWNPAQGAAPAPATWNTLDPARPQAPTSRSGS